MNSVIDVATMMINMSWLSFDSKSTKQSQYHLKH